MSPQISTFGSDYCNSLNHYYSVNIKYFWKEKVLFLFVNRRDLRSWIGGVIREFGCHFFPIRIWRFRFVSENTVLWPTSTDSFSQQYVGIKDAQRRCAPTST